MRKPAMLNSRNRWLSMMVVTLLSTTLGCSRLPTAPADPGAPAGNRVVMEHCAPATGEDGVIRPILGPIDSLVGEVQPLPSDSGIVVIQAVDGLVGGRIVAGDIQLDVPAGAIRGKVSVTVKTVGSRIDLEISPPEANGFDIPVRLTKSFPNASARTLDQLGMFWLDPALNQWVLLPSSTSDPDAHTVGASLEHFSSYQVGNKSLSKAGW